MSNKYKTLLLFGPPGVGKGTQGQILGAIPNLFHLATGDMFRSLDKSSEIGIECTKFSSKGKLVPDELTIRLWQQHMNMLIKTKAYVPETDVLILDGLPRSIEQVKLTENHLSVKKIIHLVCSDIEEVVGRMKKRAIEQNRADDADEKVIRKRFEVYEKESHPILKMFDPHLISEIDCLESPSEVLNSILNEIIPTITHIQNIKKSTPPGSKL